MAAVPDPTIAPRPRVTRVDTPDGAALAVFAFGEDNGHTPLLFLHGNGDYHGSFSKMVAAFAGERLVVCPDARDQGISGRGTAAPLTYELLAEDAVAVLDALGIERAVVLGYSDGGIEALLLARDHPERIAGFVTMGANITPDGLVEGEGDEMVADEALYRSLMESFPKAESQADLLRLMIDEPHIPAESLESISCPATIMAGEFDLIAEEETRTIAAHVPGSKLVIVPEAGHGLMRDAPDAVEAEMRELLALVKEA